MSGVFDIYPPLIRKKRSFRRSLVMYRGLLLLLVPSIVWYLVFQYFPMYGVVIAFKDYRILSGLLGSPWIGLENFQRLFRTPQFLQVLRNTLVISFLKLLWGFPAPILLALLLNELGNLRFKRVVQTVSYLPHFISWVVISGFVRTLLSPTGGAVNLLLGLFGVRPVNFMIEPGFFRSIVVVADIWKNVGWGSVIYLASIAGIDPQLYEAAVMDGAGRLRQAVSITLPSLASVMVILFLLRIGNVMSAGFEEIFNLYNPIVYSVADIFDTYVYRVGLINFDYSYSTAIGLFKNVLGLSLLVVTNGVTRRFSEYGVW